MRKGTKDLKSETNSSVQFVMVIFSCASISWFQVVSESVADSYSFQLRLAHLRTLFLGYLAPPEALFVMMRHLFRFHSAQHHSLTTVAQNQHNQCNCVIAVVVIVSIHWHTVLELFLLIDLPVWKFCLQVHRDDGAHWRWGEWEWIPHKTAQVRILDQHIFQNAFNIVFS